MMFIRRCAAQIRKQEGLLSTRTTHTRCFDPKVCTLVRECYNMIVKSYQNVLNTIHKVYIPSIKWITNQIPRFKRNGVSSVYQNTVRRPGTCVDLFLKNFPFAISPNTPRSDRATFARSCSA